MERMEDNAFDQAVRDKLDSFQPNVPVPLWERIEKELDKEHATITIIKKKQASFLWLRIAASVLLLVGALWGYVHRPREIVYLKGELKLGQQVLNPSEKEKVEEKAHTASFVVVQKVVKRKNRAESGRNEGFGGKKVVASGSDEMTKEQLRGVSFIAEEIARPTITLTDRTATHLQVTSISVPPLPEPNKPGELISVKRKKGFGVSDILNYMVGAVNKEEKQPVRFSHDDEGTLSVAVDLKAVRLKL